jgi:radical SAM superfamily enzyme YgiQ (UPF0313 family)
MRGFSNGVRFQLLHGENRHNEIRPLQLSQIDSGTIGAERISTIALGVEYGNEELRTKVLNRKMSNDVIVDAFDITHNYGMRTTANMISGMPYDREELFIDSIDLLKRAKPKSVSLNYFVPVYWN